MNTNCEVFPLSFVQQFCPSGGAETIPSYKITKSVTCDPNRHDSLSYTTPHCTLEINLMSVNKQASHNQHITHLKFGSSHYSSDLQFCGSNTTNNPFVAILGYQHHLSQTNASSWNCGPLHLHPQCGEWSTEFLYTESKLGGLQFLLGAITCGGARCLELKCVLSLQIFKLFQQPLKCWPASWITGLMEVEIRTLAVLPKFQCKLIIIINKVIERMRSCPHRSP